MFWIIFLIVVTGNALLHWIFVISNISSLFCKETMMFCCSLKINVLMWWSWFEVIHRLRVRNTDINQICWFFPEILWSQSSTVTVINICVFFGFLSGCLWFLFVEKPPVWDLTAVLWMLWLRLSRQLQQDKGTLKIKSNREFTSDFTITFISTFNKAGFARCRRCLYIIT